MPRAPITVDPFHAIADPKRRQVLGTLITLGNESGELSVNAIVKALGWRQPQVSKHLAVLRRVGLVSVRREGRKRMYHVDVEGLKPVYDWIKIYSRFQKCEPGLTQQHPPTRSIAPGRKSFRITTT